MNVKAHTALKFASLYVTFKLTNGKEMTTLIMTQQALVHETNKGSNVISYFECNN